MEDLPPGDDRFVFVAIALVQLAAAAVLLIALVIGLIWFAIEMWGLVS